MFSKAVLVRFLGPPCLEVKINRWWTIMILFLSASELSQLNFGPTKTITPHDPGTDFLSSLHIKTFTHLTCFSCYCGVNSPSIFFPLRVRFVFIAFFFHFFSFRFGFILLFSSWYLGWNCTIVIIFCKINFIACELLADYFPTFLRFLLPLEVIAEQGAHLQRIPETEHRTIFISFARVCTFFLAFSFLRNLRKYVFTILLKTAWEVRFACGFCPPPSHAEAKPIIVRLPRTEKANFLRKIYFLKTPQWIWMWMEY